MSWRPLRPIVTYGDGSRSGVALGPMPTEDLYGLALYLVAIAARGRAETRP